MYSRKQKDIAYGTNNEIKCLPDVQRFMNDPTIHRVKNSFSEFDYEGNNIFLELKSRRCNYSTYLTTMIGHNKIITASESKIPNAKYYFFFHFLDKGLHYIEYNEQLFSKFAVYDSGRKDRGKKEYRNHCFIPTHLLKSVEKAEWENKKNDLNEGLQYISNLEKQLNQ